jgi:pimeloyl-ACP methyl ester carboxylesterase
MTTRRVICAVVSVLTLSACSSSETVTRPASATDSVSVEDRRVLEWRDCVASGADCAVIQVPFDHDRPELGSFELPLVRHRARVPDLRIGILLVNPGGPGSDGSWIAENPEIYFSDVVVDRFDIIGWDPRGNGDSRPRLDCVDDMDPYFTLDPSPDDDTERTTLIDGARRFVSACIERSGAILPFVSTEATARDMDLIRQALGEEQASYFGFSYGSELGATWATLFPDTVRAAVFDGSADPGLGLVESLALQSTGFDRALEAFLDHCNTVGCAFTTPGETARQTYDRIMDGLDTSPLRVDDARPTVGQGTALVAVFASLYSRDSWEALDRALAEADDGFGDRLVTLYDGYFGGRSDGHPENLLDAYVAVTCVDRSSALDVNDAFAAMDTVLQDSPRLGATVLQELLLCAHWPAEPSPPPPVDWRGAVPILVVGSTGDPATPIEGTRRMFETLDNARLIVVDSFDHTSYGSNDCATEAIDRYLVDLVAPDGELNC